MASSKNRKIALTIKENYRALQDVENGSSTKSTAVANGNPQNTLTYWIKIKGSFIEHYQSGQFRWLQMVYECTLTKCVNGYAIREKALEFAKEFSMTDLKNLKDS